MSRQLALFSDSTADDELMLKLRAALGEHFDLFCTWCSWGNRFYTRDWMVATLGFAPAAADRLFLQLGGAA